MVLNLLKGISQEGIADLIGKNISGQLNPPVYNHVNKQ
jgi:hypothetical protein